MRILYILRNQRGCGVESRKDLIEVLRALGDARGLRIAPDHIEIEVWEESPGSLAEAFEKLVGKVIEIVEIEERNNITDHKEAVKLFTRLFNAERFWEAHTVLESVWRATGDPISRALIVAAAAFIKIQEGNPVAFEKLANEALRAIRSAGASSYYCIDLSAVAKDLEGSLITRKPLKILCRDASR